ncbi:DUF378 domain-containing protein [Salicibibacter cibarius]|uniref:DUF378 domain-containing protein n=1 Tax=Salicibibacter cibarius TaxID=2743000 RepID=A0A7T7CD05_9BACI|nr:DUF378 domain-containing protein [Salicibibacter cibarius]QQK77465.1 DUF378 domain-containing protein [Salicibibacter cibarius]
MSGLQRTALIIAIIGAVNWGLIGFFGFDLIAAIFGGQGAVFARVIYAIVGLAGLYCISLLFIPQEQTQPSPEPQR